MLNKNNSYAGRYLSDSELELFASDMRREFTHWSASLPGELTVDLSRSDVIYLPHVLQLHMQFYAVSIFLHRPFFSRRTANSDMSQQQQAQRSCVEAAQGMIAMLRMFRKQHTLRQTNVQIVHLLFTAALIHVYNTCSTTDTGSAEEKEKAMEDLQFCCLALGEIGVAWRNATRALEVIICIKREWQNNAALASRLKRRCDVVEGRDDNPMRKRRETGDGASKQLPELASNGSQAPAQTFQEQTDAWQFLEDAGQDFGINGLSETYPMMGPAFPDIFFANATFAEGSGNISNSRSMDMNPAGQS
jgi:hypothetical protein